MAYRPGPTPRHRPPCCRSPVPRCRPTPRRWAWPPSPGPRSSCPSSTPTCSAHRSQTVVLGLALFYGGLAQLLAGMWEFVKGNTFGARGVQLLRRVLVVVLVPAQPPADGCQAEGHPARRGRLPARLGDLHRVHDGRCHAGSPARCWPCSLLLTLTFVGPRHRLADREHDRLRGEQQHLDPHRWLARPDHRASLPGTPRSPAS